MLSEDEKSVINSDNMKYFYNAKYENNEKVRESWYTYVMKFLPIVNREWKELVSINRLKERISLFTAITISDEALVRWFIVLWIKKAESKEKAKGKVPHDTKANIKLYTIIHNEIEASRKDYYAAVRWNIIFWEEVEKRNIDQLETRKESSKYSTVNAHSDQLQLPDLNEDQQFLATFSLDKFTKETAQSYSKSTIDENKKTTYHI